MARPEAHIPEINPQRDADMRLMPARSLMRQLEKLENEFSAENTDETKRRLGIIEKQIIEKAGPENDQPKSDELTDLWYELWVKVNGLKNVIGTYNKETPAPTPTAQVVDIELGRKKPPAAKEGKGDASEVGGGTGAATAGGGEGGEPPDDGEKKKLTKAERKGSKGKKGKVDAAEEELASRAEEIRFKQEAEAAAKLAAEKLETDEQPAKKEKHYEAIGNIARQNAVSGEEWLRDKPKPGFAEEDAQRIAEAFQQTIAAQTPPVPAEATPGVFAGKEEPPAPPPEGAPEAEPAPVPTAGSGKIERAISGREKRSARQTVVEQNEARFRERDERFRQAKAMVVKAKTGDFGKEEVAEFDEVAGPLFEHYRGLLNVAKRQVKAHAKRKLAELDGMRKLVEAGELKGKAEQNPEERLRNSRDYKLLEKQFLRGMNVREMKFKFNREDEKRIVELFERDVKAGRDPLQRIAGDILYKVLGDYDFNELNAKDKEESEKKFLEVVRQVWNNFVYERKVNPRTGQFGIGEGSMDTDVKVSLWLLKKAGMVGAEDAQSVKAGEVVPGATHVDTGPQGVSGVFLDRLDGEMIAGFTNHPEGRDFRTSSAKILFEFLRQAGFIETNDSSQDGFKQRRAMEMMVQYTIDEDNASFPVSKEGSIADFKKSAETLRGLGRYLSADQMHAVFIAYDEGGPFGETYRKILQRKFTREELSNLGLLDEYKLAEFPNRDFDFDAYAKEYRQNKITIPAFAQYAIEQAGRRFDKSPKRRFSEGWTLRTRFGNYVVDIVQGRGDKTLAGYNAVQAYGFDGYISYDVRNNSFLINTFNPKVDLSRDPGIHELQKKTGAVIVRGNIMIRPGAKDKPFNTTLKEILQILTGKEEIQAGELITRALELESKGELKPVERSVEKWKKKKKRQEAAPSPKAKEFSPPERRGGGSEAVAEKTEKEKQREQVTRDWEEKTRGWLIGEKKTEEQIQKYFDIFRDSEVEKIMKMIEEENA
ncbi:MAG: hypothetical protein HY398_00020 [Candidatus Doudnabacteria bacterium]|nr:hypothetical protein [Candidatus Doudnabacteria bacterium]